MIVGNSEDDRIAIVTLVDEDRLGAVIGSKGRVEKYIENKLNVDIKIDTQKGKVLIITERNNIENGLRAKMIVEAIAHGISFDHAKKLIDNPDYVLEVLDISEYARNKSDMIRIKARLIGQGGKIKTLIEDELSVKISIRDKYVAILGKHTNVNIAKDVIQMICRGSKYGRALKRINDYRLLQDIY
ncbi:MAG: hypothetical protein QXH55_03805 [Candidatus Korarchaeota archaeon]|nr:hypothetical protein [Thermoproteota archaeon]